VRLTAKINENIILLTGNSEETPEEDKAIEDLSDIPLMNP